MIDNDKKFYVVVKAIVEYKGKILIIKRSDEDKIDAGTWEFPGGKVDFGETPEEALIRELKEEVSLNVNINGFLYTWSRVMDENRQIIGLTYLCESDSDEVLISFEHSDYKWIEKHEIKTNISNEYILDGLKKVNWV